MSYPTAKTAFEGVVKAMQADLERYAQNPKATQALVDIKTEQINKLVEFYEASEQLVSTLEMENNEFSYKYSKLHADTEKLVLLCKLYGIDPNMVFKTDREDLLSLYRQGKRLLQPTLARCDLVLNETKKIGPYDVPVFGFIEKETDDEATEQLIRKLF